MAGLVPAIHAAPPPLRLMIKCLVQINPARIRVKDQPRLPRARPMLHVRFPLNRVSDALVALHIDEALQALALGEARDEALAMLVGAAADVGGDARKRTPLARLVMM